jgi:hypothetical protein
MPRLCDLHTHTTASDGLLSPSELVSLAHSAGLGAIAVTDHDTCEGVPEALKKGAELGMAVIPGIEVSCFDNVGETHILGLFVDHSHAELRSYVEECRRVRDQRIEAIVVRLREQGVDITADDVRHDAGKGIATRAHVARTLVRLGKCDSIADAFRRWLADGGTAYVAKWEFSRKQGIDMIRRCGGLAVLAHPSLSATEASIAELIAMGLNGIEVIHPSIGKQRSAELRDIARRRGIVATGGSDFHGHRRAERSNVSRYGITIPECSHLVQQCQKNRQLIQSGAVTLGPPVDFTSFTV